MKTLLLAIVMCGMMAGMANAGMLYDNQEPVVFYINAQKCDQITAKLYLNGHELKTGHGYVKGGIKLPSYCCDPNTCDTELTWLVTDKIGITTDAVVFYQSGHPLYLQEYNPIPAIATGKGAHLTLTLGSKEYNKKKLRDYCYEVTVTPEDFADCMQN